MKATFSLDRLALNSQATLGFSRSRDYCVQTHGAHRFSAAFCEW